MPIELFEVVNRRGQSFSPFVWRARCALLHKGVDWRSVPMGYLEERVGFETFPALGHDGLTVTGSWEIAEHLERTFPELPPIFGDEAGLAQSRFVTHWVDSQVMPVVFRSMVADICDSARPEDQAYFRAQKEKRLGDTLEASQDRQRAKGNRLKGLLEPARRLFRQQAFLAGHSPLYADFALYGVFQWSRHSSDYAFLESDEPVLEWLERMDRWQDDRRSDRDSAQG